MRILFLCREFSALSETFIYDRVVALSAIGHDVHIVTLKRSLERERPFENVHVLRIPKDSLIQMAKIIIKVKKILPFIKKQKIKMNENFFLRKQISHIVDDVEPDLIHAEFGNMGVLIEPVAREKNKPLVVFMHGYDITQVPQDPNWAQRYQELWRNKTIIFTPSEFMRQKVISLGAPPEWVKVQHNGIIIEKLPYSRPSERYDGNSVLFLFVGRLVDKKGPRQLLEAFEIFRRLDPEIESELIICGTGPLENALRQDIHEAELEGVVHLQGACTHEQVCRWMERAHIMVQHSVTAESGDMEGLPVSLTEAAAFGLPIVATRHSGIPEIVRDGINGYLVAENDIEGMARRMLELARSPETWSRLGRAGRAIVEEQFDQHRVIASYINMVGSLAEEYKVMKEGCAVTR